MPTMIERAAGRMAHPCTRRFAGFSHAELETAFGAIAPADDWRGPISAVVNAADLARAIAAVQFYTATIPTVAADGATGLFTLTSEGYRAGPAGP